MYGKIIDRYLKVAGNSISVDNRFIINPSIEEYSKAGYVPIIESEPENREGYSAKVKYSYNKSKTKIIQSWEYIKNQVIDDIEMEVNNG